MKEMVGGCCVCSDDHGWTENPLVYCDGQNCNVAVHQACYGIIHVPTGPWFCRKCESCDQAARVRCVLCPSKDGALKRTDNGGWAHVVCALYIPEIRFGNVSTMEPIILQCIPHDRYSKNCSICEDQGKVSKASIGACMQCNKSGCKLSFHVTCAQASGLLCEEAGNYQDNVKYCGYCKHHYQKLKKDRHIKPIPAFKSITTDNDTPDGSPEKQPPPSEFSHKPRITKKSAAKIPIPDEEENNSDTSTSSEQEACKMDPGALSSKFTTANFTETVITQSGSPVFGSDKNKKHKTSKGSSQISGNFNSDSNASHSNNSPRTASPSFSTLYDSFNDEKKPPSNQPTSSEKKRPKRTSSNSSKLKKSIREEDSPISLPCKPKKRRRDKSPVNSPASIPAPTQATHNSIMNGIILPQTPANPPAPPPAPVELVLPPRPSNITTANHTPSINVANILPPAAETLEQLLERQWEQGSNFLLEQASHFDGNGSTNVASLLSCLHRLKNENNRLEDHVNDLVARRDHLLAVNARLSVPLSSNAFQSPRFMMENGGMMHSTQEQQYRKSPGHAYSPAASSGQPLASPAPSPSPATSAGTTRHLQNHSLLTSMSESPRIQVGPSPSSQRAP